MLAPRMVLFSKCSIKLRDKINKEYVSAVD
jgi:hypothetical protein